MGAHLVNEYQAFGIEAPNLHAPQNPQELVSFCCPCGPFFRLLRGRPTARQTVASLTLSPETANKNSALWGWVAQGLSSRSLASSFVAFSSSFGLSCREPSSLGGCRARRVGCRVALDRGAIYPEASGGLCLGHALLHRFDDLLSEVQRVRFHASTLPGAASSQPAVSGQSRSLAAGGALVRRRGGVPAEA